MKASEYTPSDLALMTTNFQTLFQWILDHAKSNAPENMSISIKASVGIISAEITYTLPPVASSRGEYRRPKPKPLNLSGSQGVVAEYPDLLNQPEDAGTFWFIGTKKRLDDKYNEINKKLRDNGFRYERWVKDTPHTGGWRGKK